MLCLENVSKKIGNEVILDNISINLDYGKIYGFVGRNGSGKSMLFKTICGFIIPDNGKVLFDNIDIFKQKVFPPNTRALIDKPNFISELSGEDNLEILAKIQNKIQITDIRNILKLLSLFEEKDKQVKKYSLGMKQKLGIAQVIMENPNIMIFDEPFNGLDNESVRIVRDLLLEEKNKNKLILISSHIKEDIDLLCDKVFVMDSGSIKEV